jgi:L-asparaginase II
MTMAAAELVQLWRGGLLESTHRGHVVICDEAGQIVQSWGDPERVIFPRSSCKMIQALPLLESGAADAAGLSDAHIALSCASHQGAHLIWGWARLICAVARMNPMTAPSATV